jgi:NAD(P)-dependent dehydrogenase (short-subunit alcohol dehydrogenase family)
MDIATLYSVAGKNVLVTGGGRGIGEMIAEGLVANGAMVIISSRDRQQCDATALRLNELGKGKCIAIASDLGKWDGIESLVAEVKSVTGGKLHALVNNSGKAWAQPIDQFDAKAGFDDIMFLNVTSPFELTKLCLPMLEAAAADVQRPSSIINISSIDALRTPMNATFSYSSSKSALITLTRHLAHHLAPRNITVNAIAPGPFFTKMLAGNYAPARKHWNEPDHPEVVQFKAHLSKTVPLGRLGEKHDAAGTVIYLMSKAGSYVNGATINIDGGVWLGSKL